jgi:UDPglucose--hexose-1-phosphate uridylyltransferase
MITKTIEKLIAYGKAHLSLGELDATYVRNILLKLFEQDEPYVGQIDQKEIESLNVPDMLIEELKENILPEEQESKIALVMSLISPRPDAVNDQFKVLYKLSPKAATEYLFDINVKNFYVQKSKVDKNIEWNSADGLEISINLSKPEKSNADIKKALSSSSSKYPSCLICYENLGYWGKEKFPARQNIRFIPLTFNSEQWFMQYSPYGYFYRHFILVKKEHTPMVVSDDNLTRLFDFVDLFPHFMIGSNSDLPITGGSILTHEHFQGGEHIFPMMKRDLKAIYEDPKHPSLEIGILDWYNSSIRVEGKDRDEVLNFVKDVVHSWKKYNDSASGIIAFSNNEQHNSITPFVQKINGSYRAYIILRNNLTTNEYPDGVFHAHKEYFMIKKEGIGLIEAAGKFILPARLNRQLKAIEEVLKHNISKEKYLELYPDLVDFVPFIEPLRGVKNIHESVIGKVNEICKCILMNTAVFKDDQIGKKSFDLFMHQLGLK